MTRDPDNPYDGFTQADCERSKPEPTYVWVVLQFDEQLVDDVNIGEQVLVRMPRVVEILSSETTARTRLVGHTGDSYTIQRWEVDGDLIEQVPAE